MFEIAPEDRCLTLVIAAFNEAEALPRLQPRIRAALDMAEAEGLQARVLFVDDGSRDGTWARIAEAAAGDRRVRGVSLSRNFGHQPALLAGLEHARGEAIVSMDGDLQHPPALLPAMVDAWRRGNKVVTTRRADAADTTAFKRLTSRWFYRVFSRLSGVTMAPGSSDFRLLDRVVLEEIRAMGDADLFLRGLVSWVGFPSTTLPYQASARHAGRTKYSLRKMLRFSVTALTSFSGEPLRLGIWLGFAMSVLAFAEVGYILVRHHQGGTVPGWASVMAFLSIMFAILFVLVGIVGVYVGKIHDVVKRRPRYVVHRRSAENASSA